MHLSKYFQLKPIVRWFLKVRKIQPILLSVPYLMIKYYRTYLMIYIYIYITIYIYIYIYIIYLSIYLFIYPMILCIYGSPVHALGSDHLITHYYARSIDFWRYQNLDVISNILSEDSSCNNISFSEQC